MKKRFFTFATICATVLLTACSVAGKKKENRQNGLSAPFQASVQIKIDEMDSTGTLKRYGEGLWDIEFDSPNTVSGIKLSFADGEATASYKGLSFSVPHTALPIKSMMANLISVTDELARSNELEGKAKNDMLEISGKLDSGDYILTVDKDGNIVGFAMPGSKLDMSFTDVSPLSVKTTESSEPPMIVENTDLQEPMEDATAKDVMAPADGDADNQKAFGTEE